MSPAARKTVAAINVLVWGALTIPLAWFVPLLDEVWFKRGTLFLGLMGLVIPAADVWVSTDVRTQQEESS